MVARRPAGSARPGSMAWTVRWGVHRWASFYRRPPEGHALILAMSSSRESPVCCDSDDSVSSSIAASTSCGSTGWFGPGRTQELTFDPAPALRKRSKTSPRAVPDTPLEIWSSTPPCGLLGSVPSTCAADHIAYFIPVLVGQKAKDCDCQSSKICHHLSPQSYEKSSPPKKFPGGNGRRGT